MRGTAHTIPHARDNTTRDNERHETTHAVDLFVDIVAFVKGEAEEFLGENLIRLFHGTLAGTEILPGIVAAGAGVGTTAVPAVAARAFFSQFFSQFDRHASRA